MDDAPPSLEPVKAALQNAIADLQAQAGRESASD